MKLPVVTFNEINTIATRAEAAIYRSGDRGTDIHVIENAIRNALEIFTEKLNIQMKATFELSLSKQ